MEMVKGVSRQKWQNKEILNLHSVEIALTNRKRGKRTNGKLVLGVSIGLVIGLVLGISISVFFDLGSVINPTGTGTNNQVQVSGAVSKIQTGNIQFQSLNGTIRSSTTISDYHYSIVLVGGVSYSIMAVTEQNAHYTYSLYVPSGVATFTADF